MVLTWAFVCYLISAILLFLCAFGIGSVDRVQFGWLAAAFFVTAHLR